MKIGIIGAGNVGSALGKRLAKLGHNVTFAIRDPNSPKVRKLLEECPGEFEITILSGEIRNNDVIVLATPWDTVPAVIESCGDLSDKILIDCTNPLSGLSLDTGQGISGGEQVAALAFGAKVVKAFNMTGSKNMANPNFGNNKAAMIICGNHEEANNLVKGLAGELGFDTTIAGPLENARLLEHLAMLWINLAYVQGLGPDIAFGLLKR